MPKLSVNRPRVVLHLDGLLSTSVTHGQLGEPRPGSQAFTKRLAKSCYVILVTSRNNFTVDQDRPLEPQELAAQKPVMKWLEDHKMWYDEIWTGQGWPHAELYVHPNGIVSPLDPFPDDFVELEQKILTQLVEHTQLQ